MTHSRAPGAGSFNGSRVIIVAGKGGVGKTTLAASAACAFAKAGQSSLVVSTDGRGDISKLFAKPTLSYRTAELDRINGSVILGRSLTPDEALVDYLMHRGLGKLAKRFAESGAIDLIATTTPGIKDLLIMGKIRQLATDRVADVIILDAPAAGHAITFLLAAKGLSELAGSGTVQQQAKMVLDLLGDANKCQVLLVTLAEQTPIGEVIETAAALQEQVKLSILGIAVNQVVAAPSHSLNVEQVTAEAGIDLDAATSRTLQGLLETQRHRSATQLSQIDRLKSALPEPSKALPALPRADLTREDVHRLANHLAPLLGLGS